MMNPQELPEHEPGIIFNPDNFHPDVEHVSKRRFRKTPHVCVIPYTAQSQPNGTIWRCQSCKQHFQCVWGYHYKTWKKISKRQAKKKIKAAVQRKRINSAKDIARAAARKQIDQRIEELHADIERRSVDTTELRIKLEQAHKTVMEQRAKQQIETSDDTTWK